jgi:hypothetical protein
MNPNIILHPGFFGRGFLSEVITCLTSFHFLVTRGIDPETIYISKSNFFKQYGDPINWYEERIVTDSIPNAAYFNTILSHNPETWEPHERSLFRTGLPYGLLGKYRKYIPHNKRVLDIINGIPAKTNCLGIHYRGTDHQTVHFNSPTSTNKSVSVDSYIEAIENKLETKGYDSVFIATDEEQTFTRLYTHLKEKYPNLDIQYNNCIRSTTEIPIMQLQIPEDKKIRAGDEVLLDCHNIALCKEVLCRDSNMINYASVLNPNLVITYLG